MIDELDEHVQIGRQLGVLVRRVERFWATFRVEPDGPSLERGAYLLLAQLASDGPRRLSTIAEDVCLALSTVSRHVAALEAAGLVSRTPDPTDRLTSLIGATGDGHEQTTRNRLKCQAILPPLQAHTPL